MEYNYKNQKYLMNKKKFKNKKKRENILKINKN